VLRLPASFSPLKIKEALLRSYLKISQVYGLNDPRRRKNAGGAWDIPFWDVSITCNAVLRNNRTSKLDIWWGQDFGESTAERFAFDREDTGPFVVRTAADVATLPVNFSSAAFARLHTKAFPTSDVTVLFLSNIIYIFRRHLSNFKKESRFYHHQRQPKAAKRIFKLF